MHIKEKESNLEDMRVHMQQISPGSDEWAMYEERIFEYGSEIEELSRIVTSKET